MNSSRFMNTLILGIVFLFNSYNSNAQCDTVRYAPDSLQFVFCNSLGGHANVTTADKVGDTLYVGGDFRFVGKYSAGFMPVDSSTGEIYDQSWPRADGTVKACVADGNGGVIIAGNFSRVGDVYTSGLAFIDSNGQVSSLKKFSFNGQMVNDLLIYNGVLYVGGSFSSINNTGRNNLAAISISTGTLTSWNPGCTGSGVNTLATDGTNIYVGGNYISIGSTSYADLAAVSISSGSVVTSWNPNISSFGAITKILISGNAMYVAGSFSGNLAKVNVASGNRITFSATTLGTINDLTVLGNKLYIGGAFKQVNNVTRNRIAAVDTSTGSLTSWNPNIGGGDVYSLQVVGDKIIVGGAFTTVGLLQRKSLTGVDTTNGLASMLRIKNNPGTAVYTTMLLSNKLFVGGDFATIDGEERNSLAAINLRTNKLHQWKYDVFKNGSLSSVEVRVVKGYNNILHVGGNFTQIDTHTRYGYAQINLSSNRVENTIIFNTSSLVESILPYSSYIYIGGLFSVNNNGIHENVLRINSSNNTVDTWIPIMPGNSQLSSVYDMDISGNNLYIVGNGIRNAWSGNSMLMRTNTTTGACRFLSNGSNNNNDKTFAIKVINDKIYVGGRFTIIDSVSRKNLAVFDTANLNITSYNPLNLASDQITDINIYKNRLCLAGDQISRGSSPQIARQGVALLDTANGSFIYGWKPRVEFFGFKTLFFGDTAFVFGQLYKTDDKRILGMARFHMNDTTVSASITGPDTICANSSVTFTINTSISSGTYQWRVNGNNVGTNSLTHTYAPTNGDVLSCTVIPPSNNCMITKDSVVAIDTVEVTANISPTAQLITIVDTVCAGTRVLYTANTNMPNASYQWKVGSTNYGTNSDTFSYIPSNGDVISCVATKDTSTCFSPSTATDDTTMMVKPNQTASISISDVSSGNVCAGSIDTFSATTNVTGASFQWQVNAINQGSNDSIFTYQPANNDNVRCIITMPTTGCYTQTKDTSNVIVLTQQQNIVPTISISTPSNTVCAGDVSSFSSTTNITGGTYIWRNNSVVVGSNSNLYSYTASNNDIITCTIIVPKGCYNPDSAISNSVSMVVAPKTTPSISISGPSSVGIFTPINLIANINNAGNNYSISWTNNGSQFATTTNNSTSYIKQSGTDNITATIKPSGCYDTAISNTLIIMEAVSVETVEGIGDNIEVYPNPFSDIINIKGLSIDDQVKVYDVTGRTVLQWNAKEQKEEYSYDLGALSSGMYIIEIKDMQNNLKKSIKVQKYK